MRWSSRASSDSVAPVVGNYDPAPNTAIAATASVSFDVTDDSEEFANIIITASFPSGVWEVVHAGGHFSPRYTAGSSRAPITSGFRYTCRRAGGWPSAPTIIVYALDAAGNESS